VQGAIFQEVIDIAVILNALRALNEPIHKGRGLGIAKAETPGGAVCGSHSIARN
jgi:hypothetical protein